MCAHGPGLDACCCLSLACASQSPVYVFLSIVAFCFPSACPHPQSSQKGSSMLIDSMINHDSKEARVKLEGTINGLPFVVERAVKVHRGSQGAYGD